MVLHITRVWWVAEGVLVYMSWNMKRPRESEVAFSALQHCTDLLRNLLLPWTYRHQTANMFIYTLTYPLKVLRTHSLLSSPLQH